MNNMFNQDFSTLLVAWLALVGSVCLLVLATIALFKLSIGFKTHIWPNIQQSPVNLRTKFGEWAVVTGSTDGIGKAYANELAKRGMNIVLISRTQQKLEAVAKEIEINYGVKTLTIAADFSKGQPVFDRIEEELKNIPVGILVNNVGKQYTYPMYLGEVPTQELWDIVNVNVGATTLMTRMILPQMQRRRRGAIVNVSSGSELQPLPLMTVYAASKVFIQSFSKALRYEYQNDGITIQHLSPLFVNTKMNAFSNRLRESSLFVPDAETYAHNAVNTLGMVDSTTGYWAHGLQHFVTVLAPVWFRMQIGGLMNQMFRRDYFKALNLPKTPDYL